MPPSIDTTIAPQPPRMEGRVALSDPRDSRVSVHGPISSDCAVFRDDAGIAFASFFVGDVDPYHCVAIGRLAEIVEQYHLALRLGTTMTIDGASRTISSQPHLDRAPSVDVIVPSTILIHPSDCHPDDDGAYPEQLGPVHPG